MIHTLSESLVQLGRWLSSTGYQFTTITPASHARVNARPPAAQARDLRSIFGWSQPFDTALLPAAPLGWMREAGLLEEEGSLLRSKVRFSSLGGQLYAHSAYPTSEPDAVFFGPDTYRFVSLIEAELQLQPPGPKARLLDIGCGGGPGGIAAALWRPAEAAELVLADINPRALDFAQANATLAGLDRVRFAQGDLFAAVEGKFDFIVANPPYLVDAAQRTYRHGGGAWGGGLSERIVAEGLPRLAPGGRLVLYTGAAIVDGRDPLREAVEPVVRNSGCSFSYRELDPDVFGEELETPAYAGAERIAAVALVAQRPAA